MQDRHTKLQTQTESHESLTQLLRGRALATSPRLLVGQGAAGVALNAALLLWHPDRWGIATAAMVTVASHALWNLAVQRTDRADLPFAEAGAHDDAKDRSAPDQQNAINRGWWRIRNACAFTASASALALLWFVSMMLLGRMIS